MDITKRDFFTLSFGALMLSSGIVRADAMADMAAAATAEGMINSLGMPDDWANWGAQWKAISAKYGVTHTDTDMSSAEELAKFEAEKANPSADIGEVGLEFGPIAIARGLSQPFKTTTWDQIPTWARDDEGHWALGYTGTIALLISKSVANPPKSFADLLNGTYKVSVGEVGKAAQSNAVVLAAAIAMGGSEDNLSPAMKFFGKLADAGRLMPVNASVATMEKGEVEVSLVWDFNALAWRDIVGADKFDVLIPSDGSVTSGYTTTINAYGKRPNIAKLAREFSLSDEGQILFALGYARPIRIDHITLPAEAAAKVLPAEQYAKARPINAALWSDAAKTLVQMWQEQVATKL